MMRLCLATILVCLPMAGAAIAGQTSAGLSPEVGAVSVPCRPPATIIWGPKVCPGMPTGYGLYGLAYNTAEDKIYCTYFMNSTIYKYSSDSMLTAAGTLSAPEDSCTDIDYCAYDNTFWLLANPRRTVYKITPTGTVLRQFTVPAVDYPVGIVEDDAEHKLYVTDRRVSLGAQQRIFVYDTLGNLLSTINHPKNGTYGTRCLALDPGTPSNPPSLLNMYTWFNTGGTAIDSTVLYEIDRVGLTVLNSFRFTNTNWNVRGVEYDRRDASYWITIMQDNTGGNNRVFKITGFNPPVGMAELKPRIMPRPMSITPNPVANGFAVLRVPGVQGSRGQVAEVRVFDVAGRCLITRPLGHLATGSLPLDVRKLAAGVYLVRLDADGCTATEKLVVQRR